MQFLCLAKHMEYSAVGLWLQCSESWRCRTWAFGCTPQAPDIWPLPSRKEPLVPIGYEAEQALQPAWPSVNSQ